MDYIRKANTEIPYTIIYTKVAQSTTLTFESKGLVFMLLSMPPAWVITKKWILKHFKIGRRALDRIFKELVTEGYICVVDLQKKNGKYTGKGYLIYPESVIKDYDPKDVFSASYQNEHRLNSDKRSDVHFGSYSIEQLYNKENIKYKGLKVKDIPDGIDPFTQQWD